MAACERIWRGLAGAGLAALCSHAQVQAAPQFPSSTDRAGLIAWLGEETDITPAQVVAVSASAVTAVLGTIKTAEPKGLRMALRAEAIDPQVSAREGVLSWHMQVEVDCPGHKLRTGPTMGYAERNLLGEGREIRPGSESWSEPKAGAQLESVWRAACDPGFQRPLVAPRAIAALASAPATTPEPAPSPKPAPKPTAPALRPMLALETSAKVAAPPVAPPPSRPAAPIRAMAALATPAGPRSAAAVQVGASSKRSSAEQMLASLGGRSAMQGLSTRVAAARVGGKTVYRALVAGFARHADAARFCADLKAAGEACFVRN